MNKLKGISDGGFQRLAGSVKVAQGYTTKAKKPSAVDKGTEWVEDEPIELYPAQDPQSLMSELDGIRTRLQEIALELDEDVYNVVGTDLQTAMSSLLSAAANLEDSFNSQG